MLSSSSAASSSPRRKSSRSDGLRMSSSWLAGCGCWAWSGHCFGGPQDDVRDRSWVGHHHVVGRVDGGDVCTGTLGHVLLARRWNGLVLFGDQVPAGNRL